MRKFGWRFPFNSVVGISGFSLTRLLSAVCAATTVSGGVFSPGVVAVLACFGAGAQEEGFAVFSGSPS